MSITATAAPHDANPFLARRNFWTALIANFIWINASEIWRFLFVIRPMLQAAYPGRSDIRPFTLPVFVSWSVWDTVLILAATGFYWLYMNWAGRSVRHALVAATYFTITIFGLIWLGVVNMGFVPPRFIWVALPLAWIEQAVAAIIVCWAMGRQTS